MGREGETSIRSSACTLDEHCFHSLDGAVSSGIPVPLDLPLFFPLYFLPVPWGGSSCGFPCSRIMEYWEIDPAIGECTDISSDCEVETVESENHRQGVVIQHCLTHPSFPAVPPVCLFFFFFFFPWFPVVGSATNPVSSLRFLLFKSSSFLRLAPSDDDWSVLVGGRDPVVMDCDSRMDQTKKEW